MFDELKIQKDPAVKKIVPAFVFSMLSAFTSPASAQFVCGPAGTYSLLGINVTIAAAGTSAAAGAIACGTNSTASGANSVAVGENVTVSGNQAVGLGSGATASANATLALGSNSTASQANALAVGVNTNVTGLASLGVGNGAAVGGAGSIGLGVNANVLGSSGIGIGNGVTVAGNNAVAIGVGASAAGLNSVAFGTGTVVSGAGSTALGVGVSVSGAASLALGGAASAAGNNAVAVGVSASANASGGIAIGQGSIAGFTNSVAIGTGVATTAANQISLGVATNSIKVQGITSVASVAAQVGPIQLVTTDNAGNLAAVNVSTLVSGASFDPTSINNQLANHEARLSRVESATAQAKRGVAAAMSLTGGVAPPEGKQVAVSASIGTFGGEQAIGTSAAVRVRDGLYVSGGVAVTSNEVGGRAAVTMAW